MPIAEFDAGARHRLANGHGTETELLANGGDGVAVGIELGRLLYELWCQLFAGAQGDTATPEMTGRCGGRS